MPLELTVMSLRYSSWSIRAWLALTHAGASFTTTTVGVGTATQPAADVDLATRRAQGSVTGLFPVLHVDGESIHEALAICELAAERFPDARLWPAETMDRARARAVSTEMATGFPHLREHLSCHPFARVPGYRPPEAAQAEIERVFEVWSTCLARSGGPFLFGRFGIADCMYFPVVTRFRTYGVTPPPALSAYSDRVMAVPAAQAWRSLALRAPRIPAYDAYIVGLGGDPDAITA